MNKDEIKKGINNLKFTQAMILYDPNTGNDREYEQLNQDDKDTFDGCTAGIKALYAVEKYAWHDLRNNPDDLPVPDSCMKCIGVIVKVKDIFEQFSAYYDCGEFTEVCGEEVEDVIAWRYIEPWEEN